jgi:CubicO group peptidase (beta-lactamase class C family)
MKLRSLLAFAFSIVALAAVCNAQPSDRTVAARIDRYIASQMHRYKIPGMSVAVVRNGKVSILKSYGLANVELGVPVKPETIFQSGSIGKQLTAAAIMVLVQEGKISLDDRVNKYLPDTPAAWNDITIRHLLTQTSGLGDYPPEIELRRDYTEDQFIDIFKKAPLNFAPGTDWDYSNVGYVTLGIIISKVTGKFYGEFLREKVFKPLGMTTARVISEEDIVPNRAAGYRLVNSQLKNQEWVSPSTNSTADGSYYVSILDLVNWDLGLESTRANALFTQPTLDQLWQPTKLSEGRVKGYGFGWFTMKLHNRRVAFHGGAWQGFKSYIVKFLDDKLTIIFLANSWEANDFRIARGLMSIFYPELAADESFGDYRSEPKVTQLVQRALLGLANDNVNKELFTAELQSELFPAKAKQIWEQLRSLSLPVAVIHLSELVEKKVVGDLRVYRYAIVDIGQSMVCTVKLRQDDKIAGIEIGSESR